jgi:hypothetical protein
MVFSAIGDVKPGPFEDYGHRREKAAGLAPTLRAEPSPILAEAPSELKPQGTFLAFIFVDRHGKPPRFYY